MNAPLTAQQAATKIVALINAQPTSPRQDEIEAVISETIQSALGLSRRNDNRSDDLAHWDGILRTYLDNLDQSPSDERAMELSKALCAETNAIWSKPVRTWDDLIVRAAIACHWNTLDEYEPAYPDDVLAGDPQSQFRRSRTRARRARHPRPGRFEVRCGGKATLT